MFPGLNVAENISSRINIVKVVVSVIVIVDIIRLGRTSLFLSVLFNTPCLKSMQ